MSYSKSLASTDQLLRHYKTSNKNFQSTASDKRSEKKSSGRITPHEKRAVKSAKKKQYFQKPSGRLSTQTYEQRQKIVRDLLRKPIGQ
jgi:16S rRNA U516 pseudouridylate synthase RsuA-like enzyme